MAFASVGLAAMMATPAFATTFTTCNTVTGGATLNPGISSTLQSSAASSGDPEHPGPAAISGCSGPVSSGSLAFSGTTVPGDCQTLGNPVNGKVVISGTFTITWNAGSPSKGSLKAKSIGGDPTHVKLILKITSGQFAGTSSNPTKAKDTTGFTIETESPPQDCVTTPVKHVFTTNSTNLVIASAH